MKLMAKRTFRVWRGDSSGGEFQTYEEEVDQGMVVLDVLHRIQARQAGDLAMRWNCKAGKCGSCSMEINGKPRLSCMTRMNSYAPDETITVQPIKSFPVIKDLVTDVSWNYEQNKRIRPFTPKPRGADGEHRMYQEDVDRVQEHRKCIECFLCQNVCHVVRDRGEKDRFVGPRFMLRVASLEMHPLDDADRIPEIRNEYGSGMCNITKCCTEVCPEHINITDNAIIPLKERVVDRYFDPVIWLGRKLFGISKRKKPSPYQAKSPGAARAGETDGAGE
jgi:succinate dehydrogenase / fumarate reductase iron-sulfur subunit